MNEKQNQPERPEALQCPRCQCRLLQVEVTFTGTIECAFQANGGFEVRRPVSLESVWDPDSGCVCLDCNWEGTIAAMDGPPPGA